MFGLSATVIRWVGIVLLVLATIFGIYYKGRLDERKLFNTYKAEVKAAAMAQEAETKRIEAKNQRLIEETKNAYNTKLAALRSYYSLRIAGKGGSGLPQIPITTGGVDDYSPDNLPSTAVLASQCAETTLKLIMLQNYERSKAIIVE